MSAHILCRNASHLACFLCLCHAGLELCLFPPLCCLSLLRALSPLLSLRSLLVAECATLLNPADGVLKFGFVATGRAAEGEVEVELLAAVGTRGDRAAAEPIHDA